MNASEHDIRAYLTERGWKAGGFGRRQETTVLTDPHGDYQLTWDGDIWRLARFDDSDNAHGIAEARWLNIDEGETLADLKPCLRSIGYGINRINKGGMVPYE